MREIAHEFRKFIARGSVVDMAVGIIVGGAFGALVKSLVSDVVMPPIGLLLGGVDFADFFLILKAGEPAGPYATLAAAQAAGAVVVAWGMFVNTLISFLIVAMAVFLLVRGVNRIHERLAREASEVPPAPPQPTCPWCRQSVHPEASRCPHCTSNLETATGEAGA